MIDWHHLLLFVPSVLLGWYAHLWWCKRRHGCPVLLEEYAREWDVKAELNGWHRRKKQPPVDSETQTGVPLERMETPVTGVANKNRKTTP